MHVLLALAAFGALLAPLAAPGESVPTSAGGAAGGDVVFSPSTCKATSSGYSCTTTASDATPTPGPAGLRATLAFPGTRMFKIAVDSTSASRPELVLLAGTSALRTASREGDPSTGASVTQEFTHVADALAGALAIEARYDSVAPDLRTTTLRVDVSNAPETAPASQTLTLAAGAREAGESTFRVALPSHVALAGKVSTSVPVPSTFDVTLASPSGVSLGKVAAGGDGAFSFSLDAPGSLGTFTVLATPTGSLPGKITGIGLAATATLTPLVTAPAPSLAALREPIVPDARDATGDAASGDVASAWYSASEGGWLVLGARVVPQASAPLVVAWTWTSGGAQHSATATLAASGAKFVFTGADGKSYATPGNVSGPIVQLALPASATGLAPGARIESFKVETSADGGATLDAASATSPRAWDGPAPTPSIPTPTVPIVTSPSTASPSHVSSNALSPLDYAMRVGFVASAVGSALVLLAIVVFVGHRLDK